VDYEAVIGMEVHAQILTRSKLFCGCSSDYAAAPPNTHTCPVCLAMPGVLPVINRAAVEATVRAGLALGCEVPPFTKFDRKNYHYPDLPKGYQISQYDHPLCQHGHLDVLANGQPKRIRIRRVHLEEDTAKLVHAEGSSLIDFNRSGVPLMEIVTESDLRSAEEAYEYLTKLHTILRYLGVSTGNMEEGAMRCEVNISIRPRGCETYGTKVEVKNLNSFRSVRLAIEYEMERQARLLNEGGHVEQVTMGWDERSRRTVFQRTKEEAQDYRYFPDPDLPPLEPSREWVERMRASLPELPAAKTARLAAEYGLRADDAALLAEDRAIADFFEAAARAAGGVAPQAVANWTLGEVFRLLREGGTDLASAALTPALLAELVGLVESGAINATVGKDVLTETFSSGEAPTAIVERRGLRQISGGDELREVVRQALDANARAVSDYLGGKTAVMGFLIGQVMRLTRGKANAQTAEALLTQALEERRA
jgi:aspartyl-tRNA(Asn)/glutamyl-tRNA(Gln) amidotransferase subunit B